MIFINNMADDGIRTVVEYKDRQYTVTCSKGDLSYSESFGQTFTPVCGMDVADNNQANIIADKLAEKILIGEF